MDAQLNPPQQQAVDHAGGPLLIVAGAGSGKTKTLTSRIVHLLERGVLPDRILAITFTNKAAQEMKERVSRALIANRKSLVSEETPQSATHNLRPATTDLPVGRQDPRLATGDMPFVGTFHSWGARFLKLEGHRIGRTRNFSIFDDDDALRLLKGIVKNMGIDKERYNPAMFRARIGKIKNELAGHQSVVIPASELGSTSSSVRDPYYAGPHSPNFLDQLVSRVYESYETALQENNAFDFDDLIEKPVRIFIGYPDVLQQWQARYDHILVDEYQDTNSAQYALIKCLAGIHKNLSVVGDDAQCVLPETFIATKRGQKMIKEIKRGETICSAGGNGEVCEAKVLKIYKRKYNGKLIKITTKTGKEITLTPNHLIFTRLQLVRDIYFVYLMYRKDKGFRIGIAKGARWGPRGKKQIGLVVRNNQEKADKMWVLRVCTDRGKAEYYEFLYAFQYGIPTVVFDTNNRNMKLSQQSVDRLFTVIDTKERAQKLFKEELLYFAYPHWIPQGTIRHTSRRLRIRVALFDDKRKSIVNPWGMSRISVNTKDELLKKEIEKLGFKTRKGKLHDWRMEIVRLRYKEIEKIAKSLQRVNAEIEIVRSACLTTKKRLFFQPASHARVTMATAIYEQESIVEDDIERVVIEEYNGLVYDLDVEHVHNYIANGIVVHNSIYAFRGSDFRNFLNFERDWEGATVIKLEENYRSTGNIIGASSAVIRHNIVQKPKTLWTKNKNGNVVEIHGFKDESGESYFVAGRILALLESQNAEPNIAVLYRTNAQSRAIEQALLQNSIPYRIYGGLRFYDRMEIKDIIAALQYAANPKNSMALERLEKNFGKKEMAMLASELPERAKTEKLLDLINFFLESTDYIAAMEKQKNGEERIENINELIMFAGTFNHLGLMTNTVPEVVIASPPNRRAGLPAGRQGTPSESMGTKQPLPSAGLTEFLEQVSLVSSLEMPNGRTAVRAKRLAGGVVHLMTIHAAKGLEFNQVFVAGCSEGLLPHGRSIGEDGALEEERRLMYVAMTRARLELTLTFHETPSRFLYEIPAELTMFKNHTPAKRKLESFEDEDFIEYD